MLSQGVRRATLRTFSPQTTRFGAPRCALSTEAVTEASKTTIIVDEADDEEEEIDLGDLHMGRSMKPREVVAELDKHIVGQPEAKRAVAVALRNRWRRHKLDESLKMEVTPKNILMVGPTGCGKTEVARRLAKITDAPFLKVEATKFTEIGFHGRDVDSIIRDLVESAMIMVKNRMTAKLTKKVARIVEERILDAMIGKHDKEDRKTYRKHLRLGELESLQIDVEVPVKEDNPLGSNPMMGNNVMLIQNVRGLGRKTEKKTMPVSEARSVLIEIEIEKLLNTEDVTKEAIKAVEQDGIVFLDEIDKICNSRHNSYKGPDASAEGVQRDLLPLLEGCVINTKHGNVNTDHILFIASGAFHSNKPADLLAELQGRLPIRVELKGLTENDFVRILTEPEHNLIKQQVELIKTEGVELQVREEAIKEIARVAAEANRHVENIGARRLHTIIERVMDDISFEASDHEPGTEVEVSKELVEKQVSKMLERTDLKKFIL